MNIFKLTHHFHTDYLKGPYEGNWLENAHTSGFVEMV